MFSEDYDWRAFLINIYVREVEHKLLSDRLYNQTFHEQFELWPSTFFASYRRYPNAVSHEISNRDLVSGAGIGEFAEVPFLDRSDFLDFKELVFNESSGGRRKGRRQRGRGVSIQRETVSEFQQRVSKAKELLHDFGRDGVETAAASGGDLSMNVLTWKVPTPANVLAQLFPDPADRRYEDFEWRRVPNATATLEFDDPNDHSLGASKFNITFSKGAKKVTFGDYNDSRNNRRSPLIFFLGAKGGIGAVVEVSEVDEVTWEAHLSKTYYGDLKYTNVHLYSAVGAGIGGNVSYRGIPSVSLDDLLNAYKAHVMRETYEGTGGVRRQGEMFEWNKLAYRYVAEYSFNMDVKSSLRSIFNAISRKRAHNFPICDVEGMVLLGRATRGLAPSYAEAKAELDKADTNNDGSLDAEEFLDYGLKFRDGLVGKKTGVGGYGADAFESIEERGKASEAFARQLRNILRRIKRIKRVDTFDVEVETAERTVESEMRHTKAGAKQREEVPSVKLVYGGRKG